MTPEEKRNVVPRVCIIGGKAAPGYEIAKKIIKLVNAVGVKINNDGDIGNLLKVVSPSLPNHVSIQHMAKLVCYALKQLTHFFPSTGLQADIYPRLQCLFGGTGYTCKWFVTTYQVRLHNFSSCTDILHSKECFKMNSTSHINFAVRSRETQCSTRHCWGMLWLQHRRKWGIRHQQHEICNEWLSDSGCQRRF